jgi:hypothetical protein
MPVSKKQRRWSATAAGREALGAAKASEWTHATDQEIAAEKKKLERSKPRRRPAR